MFVIYLFDCKLESQGQILGTMWQLKTALVQYESVIGHIVAWPRATYQCMRWGATGRVLKSCRTITIIMWHLTIVRRLLGEHIIKIPLPNRGATIAGSWLMLIRGTEEIEMAKTKKQWSVYIHRQRQWLGR